MPRADSGKLRAKSPTAQCHRRQTSVYVHLSYGQDGVVARALGAKRLELLRELLPDASVIGVLRLTSAVTCCICSRPVMADFVAKVFLHWRSKILLAVDANFV
jgi:hypothetical protein